MRKSTVLNVTVLLLLGCGVVRAQPPATESPADLVALHQMVRVSGLDDRRFNHAAYWDAVSPYLNGRINWEVAGISGEGRDIRRITFGTGPVSILLWSQMHGDESTATMALADIIRFFHDFPEHPLARRIAEGASVHMLPMLNPDGAERFRRRNAQGIDVNRDARRLQTPEGRILKAVRDAVQPEFGFNLHDQGTDVRVGESSRIVAIALLAPAFDEPRSVDAKRHRAMQVASVLVESMSTLVGDHIAKYDDTFNPRAFGDLMGAWGASTVLIESGGWANDPQKQYLRRVNFVGILNALDAIATGIYERYEPNSYEALEFNGQRLSHLLVLGGILAVPGLPTLTADLLVNYENPLLKEGGIIAEIGDLGPSEALDTLQLDGLYLIPGPEALDDAGGINAGSPAVFAVAEDSVGQHVQFRFEGKISNR